MQIPPRGPGRRSKAEAALTKEKVLDKAQRLFAQKGFGRVSMREIGEAAGVHQKTIQHHFGSKAGLYGAVLSRWDAALVDKLTEAASGSDDIATAAERVVDTLFDFFLDKRDWVALSARTAFGEKLPPGVKLNQPGWAKFTSTAMASRNLDISELDIRRLLITVEGVFYSHTLAHTRYRALFGKDIRSADLREGTKRHLKYVVLSLINVPATDKTKTEKKAQSES